MKHSILIVCLALLACASSASIPGDSTHLNQRASIRAAILYGSVVSPYTVMRVSKGTMRSNVRSVGLAFGMSALLPGAGQAYNRQYIKTGVAIALEAAVITGYSVLRSRGLDAETDFRKVAHASWDPRQYASWINDYKSFLRDEFGTNVTAPSVVVASGIDFNNPAAWSAADRSAVRDMFSQIRAIERQVFHPETGAAFSHQLPDFSEQQYYELIGKYFQFAPGWEDYPVWKDSEGNFTAAIDPEKTASDGSKPNVSDSFFKYAREHADAQDTLRRASRISLLLIFNHLVAGIDAAVSAKLHNDRVQTSLGLSYDPDGSPIPVASMRIRF